MVFCGIIVNSALANLIDALEDNDDVSNVYTAAADDDE